MADNLKRRLTAFAFLAIAISWSVSESVSVHAAIKPSFNHESTGNSSTVALSLPMLSDVGVEANGNLTVRGSGFLPGAEIEINNHRLSDTKLENTANSSLLTSAEMWRVYAAPGRLVNVTVINPDGVRSVPRSFARLGVSFNATTVSAASYLATDALTPEGIATVFGFNLAIGSDVADATPLPNRLAGTTVRVNGILAPLFYVSPGQINFLIPAKTPPGTAIIEITSADGTISRSEIKVAAIAPAIFTANSQGTGAPAALATADGIIYYGVGNPDGTSNYVQTGHYLVMYGTGFRYALSDEVKITIGGINAPVLYAGAQPNFLGLDQINTQIPTGISGTVDLVATVNGKAANVVKLRVK